jgi:CYTH domain-containing protein
MTEIERKFVPTGPVPAGANVTSIRQAYLAIDGSNEVRIRARSGHHTLTVKSGAGIERDEVELVIDPVTFERLWALAPTRRIEKHRSEIEIDSRAEVGRDGRVGRVVAEIDRYSGALDGLVVVEVEFDDLDAAAAFDPPDWFGREVTGDPAWSNAALASTGRVPSAAPDGT